MHCLHCRIECKNAIECPDCVTRIKKGMLQADIRRYQRRVTELIGLGMLEEMKQYRQWIAEDMEMLKNL